MKDEIWGWYHRHPNPVRQREVFDPLPDKKDNNWVTGAFDDSKFEEDRRSEFLQSTDLLAFRTIRTLPIPDDCLVLLPPRIYGYALLDHKWCALDINLISDISVDEV